MNYRDSIVWNKAMRMAELACICSRELPQVERYGMRSQISRAAISVPCNIAEGWARESRKEKAHFLAIAHGSVSELHTQLLLCQRLGWIPAEMLTEVLSLTDEISRMLTSLRRKLRAAKHPATSSSFLLTRS